MALSDLLAGLKEEAAGEEAQLDAETRAEVTRIAAAAHDEAQQIDRPVHGAEKGGQVQGRP